MSEQASGVNLTNLLSSIRDWFSNREPKITQLEQSVADHVANLAKVQNEITQIKTDLTTAQAQVTVLTVERDAALADAAAARKALADVEPEIARRANVLAGERLSKVGVAALKEETKIDPNQSNNLFDQFNAETDPVKREALYQRIKTESWK